jgi:hypothetical protein
MALLLTAYFGSALPLHGFGIVATLLLAAVDIVLIQATGAMAFRRTVRLDERQRRLRDLAYRRGFRLVGLAIVLMLVLATVSEIVLAIGRPALYTGGLSDVNGGLAGLFVVAAAEILVMMPTLVIAWIETDGPEPEMGDDAPGRARRRLLAPWLALPAIAAVWLLAVAWAPAQAAPGTGNGTGGFPDANCRWFTAGTILGAQFGATVGLRANVCWNGEDAFVVGNPSLPIPAGAIQKAFPASAGWVIPTEAEVNPPSQLLSGCGLDNLDDFASVTGTRCTERIDADGTMHYSVSARVSPLPFSIGAREVTIDLVVTRNGRVLEQP